jgi:hypothetical protein
MTYYESAHQSQTRRAMAGGYVKDYNAARVNAAVWLDTHVRKDMSGDSFSG